MIGIRQQEIADLGLWAKIRRERLGWNGRQLVALGADDSVGV
jgi:hypothetical protein